MAGTYGKSSEGNLAFARHVEREHGVWDAVEVAGDFYRIVDYDSLSEDEMDRMDELETPTK